MDLCPWCAEGRCRCGRMMLAAENEGTCAWCGHGDVAYSVGGRKSPTVVLIPPEVLAEITAMVPGTSRPRNDRSRR